MQSHAKVQSSKLCYNWRNSPGLASEQWDEWFGHTLQECGAGEWFINSHNHKPRLTSRPQAHPAWSQWQVKNRQACLALAILTAMWKPNQGSYQFAVPGCLQLEGEYFTAVQKHGWKRLIILKDNRKQNSNTCCTKATIPSQVWKGVHSMASIQWATREEPSSWAKISPRMLQLFLWFSHVPAFGDLKSQWKEVFFQCKSRALSHPRTMKFSLSLLASRWN